MSRQRLDELTQPSVAESVQSWLNVAREAIEQDDRHAAVTCLHTLLYACVDDNQVARHVIDAGGLPLLLSMLTLVRWQTDSDLAEAVCGTVCNVIQTHTDGQREAIRLGFPHAIAAAMGRHADVLQCQAAGATSLSALTKQRIDDSRVSSEMSTALWSAIRRFPTTSRLVIPAASALERLLDEDTASRVLFRTEGGIDILTSCLVEPQSEDESYGHAAIQVARAIKVYVREERPVDFFNQASAQQWLLAMIRLRWYWQVQVEMLRVVHITARSGATSRAALLGADTMTSIMQTMQHHDRCAFVLAAGMAALGVLALTSSHKANAIHMIKCCQDDSDFDRDLQLHQDACEAEDTLLQTPEEVATHGPRVVVWLINSVRLFHTNQAADTLLKHAFSLLERMSRHAPLKSILLEQRVVELARQVMVAFAANEELLEKGAALVRVLRD